MILEVLGLYWTVERVRILSVDRTFSSAAALAICAFFSSLRKRKRNKSIKSGSEKTSSFSNKQSFTVWSELPLFMHWICARYLEKKCLSLFSTKDDKILTSEGEHSWTSLHWALLWADLRSFWQQSAAPGVWWGLRWMAVSLGQGGSLAKQTRGKTHN